MAADVPTSSSRRHLVATYRPIIRESVEMSLLRYLWLKKNGVSKQIKILLRKQSDENNAIK